jgi:RHS repeat-associated protein
LQQIIDGDTTDYLYDAANRLEAVDGQSYVFDDNGNLLTTGAMTNTWDAANRLTQMANDKSQMANHYNGVGDRVAQTVGVTTTYLALDVQGGLPEVIYTSEDNSYLHLPGVIMVESAEGEVRYLLSDGLGSVRQAVDENAEVVVYNEYDPYGNPVHHSSLAEQGVIPHPFGYTGEWWQDEVGLLHLRARWYLPETGTFLSVDPVESEPAYQYVHGNPITMVDPSGRTIVPWDVGVKYMYSCGCGWINFSHAGRGEGMEGNKPEAISRNGIIENIAV